MVTDLAQDMEQLASSERGGQKADRRALIVKTQDFREDVERNWMKVANKFADLKLFCQT
jgi:hypothetical protein